MQDASHLCWATNRNSGEKNSVNICNNISRKIILQKIKNMKKLVLILCSVMLVSLSSFAQRYAVIDTKYILDKMPEYKDADTKLQQISDQWQKEIDQRQAELDK